MDYTANSELVKLSQNGDRNALEKLVLLNGGLIRSIATRFVGRGTELDDLVQIGTIGFIKAAKSFDASFGTVLSTYAVPLIVGEIKRFLRDDGMIKVSREAKRNFYTLMRKKEEILLKTGIEPTVSELCGECGISKEDAVYALSAGSNVVSLDTPKSEDEPVLENLIGTDGTDGIIEHIALKNAVSALPDMQRKIIALRYSKGLSQAKTAEILGLSQVKVSREEKKIYGILRKAVG